MSSDDRASVVAERYKLLGQIGQGGMGAVFEAVHVCTGRRLAVKKLLPEYAHDASLVERFMREARAMAAVGGPHVVEVVDVVRTPGGEVFMVMELLVGRELKRAIREDAPLPVARACYISHQVATVMGCAHAIGIVHRDLKPANVFLTRRDKDPDYVKVLDFGIAKFGVSAAPDVEGGTLTRTGQIIGTPPFMSPEQLQGLKELDARSDVYSLGVMLYQSLSGQLPVRGDSIPEIFLKVMTTEPPPLKAFRDDVPPELAAIVRRAMAREASGRFEDGAAFAAAIEPFAARWTPGGAPTVADLTLRSPAVAGGGARKSSPPAHSVTAVVATTSVAGDPQAGVGRATRLSALRRVVLSLAACAGVAALAMVGGRAAPWRYAGATGAVLAGAPLVTTLPLVASANASAGADTRTVERGDAGGVADVEEDAGVTTVSPRRAPRRRDTEPAPTILPQQ